MCDVLLRHTIYNPRLFWFFVHPRSMVIASARAKIAAEATNSQIHILLPLSPSEKPNLFQMIAAVAAYQLQEAGYKVTTVLRDLDVDEGPKTSSGRAKQPPWLRSGLGVVSSLARELTSVRQVFNPIWEAVRARLSDQNPESITYFRQLLGMMLLGGKNGCNAMFIGQPEAVHIEPLLRLVSDITKTNVTLLPLYSPQLYLDAVPRIYPDDTVDSIQAKLVESLERFPRPVVVLKGELLAIAHAALSDDACHRFEQDMDTAQVEGGIERAILSLAQAIEVQLCRRFSK